VFALNGAADDGETGASFMTTFIMRLPKGTGVRVALKDIFDMAGLPTTVGSRAWALRARPAEKDAACLVGLRRAEQAGTAQIVGRTNLHEFCFGLTGINPWYGTPVNPLDHGLVPGGSSSGSAVAVGSGEADIAFGSDTGGSVRIPAACCGIAGLKTTLGRISLEGVWPLSVSLDTVGPMARDVAGLAQGMALLEPGFQVTEAVPEVVGRLRLDVDPALDAALDEALLAAGLRLEDVRVPSFGVADSATVTLLSAEAWALYGHMLGDGSPPLGEDIAARLRNGGAYTDLDVVAAKEVRSRLQSELDEVFQRVPLLALPTLIDDPAPLEEAHTMYARVATRPANLVGLPAVTIPVPRPGRLPASLQLIGPARSEGLLLATAREVEAAIVR
jgi:amidase